MAGRPLSVNSAALILIAVCILATAILVAVTSSDHPAVVTAAAETPTTIAHRADTPAVRAITPSPGATDAVSASAKAAPASTPVTISGCLERDGDSFRLVGTTGAAAPKSRNWKSGFLKKGTAPVAVVDEGKRLNLSRHVGERVGVTGVLSAKSLQAHSISRVARKCE